MPLDWTGEFAQDFAYYEVDPETWGDVSRIDGVTRCTVTRDATTDTLETAEIEADWLPDGERWVRAYMDAVQDGVRYRVPVGTWVVQTPTATYDKVRTVTCRCYSALHPLSEAKAGIYSAPKGANCATECARILETYGVAPVMASESTKALTEHYVAPFGASWLEVAKAIAASGDLEIGVDSLGRVTLSPARSALARSIAWEFAEGAASILEQGVEETADWYGLPNVCIVKSGGVIGRAVNDDPSSPISTRARGREVTLAVEDPDELKGGATTAAANAVALKLLSEASVMEREVRFSHGYAPVNVGDRVRVRGNSPAFDAVVTVRTQNVELATGARVEATGTWNFDLMGEV